MPGYFRSTLAAFSAEVPSYVLGELHAKYAIDGYVSQLSSQTSAWANAIPLLQQQVRDLIVAVPNSKNWSVFLEFPIYRLRKRLDAVVLAEKVIIVIEMKVGEGEYRSEDERQVEEYALDLRDFHEGSRGIQIAPVLWCTAATTSYLPPPCVSSLVLPVARVGAVGLARAIIDIVSSSRGARERVAESWEMSPYRPVPSVIQAATSIFAGHDVRAITNADASNLREAATRLVQLITWARKNERRALVILTGVPGSGKTLAGLQVVHDAVASGAEALGDIVYLSGNTPLVTVLREALARDEHRRASENGAGVSLKDVRRSVRARIQHINDFVKASLVGPPGQAPHEHVIIFDEAQRAWDEAQGEKKFGRKSSEPSLILDIMGRHPDWCVAIGLVGSGQEINTGEMGLNGWGSALRALPADEAATWSVFGPPEVCPKGDADARESLGPLPVAITVVPEPDLKLTVSLRSYRAPTLNEWVTHVLNGDQEAARMSRGSLKDYPVLLTRDIAEMKKWLRALTRGQRRCGLVASSGARRLRADGLGVTLSATDGIEIAHWYLNEYGDLRSSLALEVPANEYTAQGLELDFVGVCWGGDFIRVASKQRWLGRRLSGPRWQNVGNTDRNAFIVNSYRVLLTRAREGMIIWVPVGDQADATRDPRQLDETAEFLAGCGCTTL